MEVVRSRRLLLHELPAPDHQLFHVYGVYQIIADLIGDGRLDGVALRFDGDARRGASVGFLSMAMRISWTKSAAIVLTTYVTLSNVSQRCGNWLAGPLRRLEPCSLWRIGRHGFLRIDLLICRLTPGPRCPCSFLSNRRSRPRPSGECPTVRRGLVAAKTLTATHQVRV